VIKGWDEGIIGGDGVPPMLAGTFFYRCQFILLWHAKVKLFTFW